MSHCGAGCTLGDLCAEWPVFGFGATIIGLSLLPEYIGSLALAFGIAFQYSAIAPMHGLGLRKGIKEAMWQRPEPIIPEPNRPPGNAASLPR